jgi:hypothetical protein
MAINADLCKFLRDAPAVASIVANRVHENLVPQRRDKEYIWLALIGKQYDHCLDDEPGTPPRSLLFTCECCSPNLAKSNELADAVRNLFPYRGPFGTTAVRGAFANDQSEDYEPVNAHGEEVIHVQALQIELCP